MDIAVLLFLLFLIIVSVRFSFSVLEIAYLRKKIFEDIQESPHILALCKLGLMSEVSMCKQLWHSLTFRNIKNLYDPLLFDPNYKNKIISIKKSDGKVIYGYYDDNNSFNSHNDNGPAIIRADGTKEWWSHNELHNDNGPAVIWGGSRYTDWYISGKLVTDEVYEWCQERNLDPDNLSEEDQFALSFFLRSFS